MDYYWGGSERRITGLTVRIMGINALMLVLLLASVFVLGQYHETLIKAKLETVEAEAKLIVAALSTEDLHTDGNMAMSRMHAMVARLQKETDQRIIVFDRDGLMRLDSYDLATPPPADDGTQQTRVSLRILRSAALMVLKLLPGHGTLPAYRHPETKQAADFPFVAEALTGAENVLIWEDQDEQILLSISTPLYTDQQIMGAVFLLHPANDIGRQLDEAWLNILKIFGVTLIFVVLLSIYFSGVITRPMKKLARAAEGVRKGRLTYEDIPDFTDRHDEIGELSIALRLMTRALSERIDSIEAFAADVAHELKNPLTSLRSAIETLAVVKKKQDREKLLDIIRHDVGRLHRLINDISEASKLDTALSRDMLERTAPVPILRALLDLHKAPLSRADGTQEGRVLVNDITVVLHGSDVDTPAVWGVGSRLEQVFQNLLANALSFSPPDGTINIYVQPHESDVQIMFEDEGPGIPVAGEDKIFNRFYSHRPQHEAYGMHSGLGLSICRQIVEACGGQIFAENILDSGGAIQGARFTVLLKKA